MTSLFSTPPQPNKIHGGDSFIQTYIEALVAESNSIYSSNGVGIRLSLALMEETMYSEGTDRLGTHLRRLQSQDDGYMDEVHEKRDRVEADLVHLLSKSPDEFERGVSTLMAKVSVNSADRASFSTSSANANARLFVHELGHSMGLHHDRFVACDADSCPATAYPYAYGYVNQRAFDSGAPIGSRWRTIMAYRDQCEASQFTCASTTRFSDPTSSFREDPLGIGGSDQVIRVDGPSDSVRALNNTRETVARIRGANARFEGPSGERFVDVTWSLIPPGLGVGDSFRLLFVSSVTELGTFDAIDTYDKHVRAAADSGHPDIRAYGSHFRVLASTSSIDARDHTGTTYTVDDAGVPIYWLGGDKVAENYSDFYDGEWDSNASRDELGSAAGVNEEPFTGSKSDGTKFPGEHIGTTEGSSARVGKPTELGKELDAGKNRANTQAGTFYGLSGVFTVIRDVSVPNRATLAVAPDRVLEGSGETDLTVTLTLEEPEVTDTEVELEVHDWTALSPEDFTAIPRILVVKIPANETSGTATLALTAVYEQEVEPECDEAVILKGASASGSRSALTFSAATLTITDPDSDALRCMAPVQRDPIDLKPDGPPNPPREPETEVREPVAPPEPQLVTDATFAIWTDRTGYALGQPVLLYRSADSRGDNSKYTFFYYLENIGTGTRFYFAPGIGSTTLEEEAVDHSGLSGGAYRAGSIKSADKELIWAGAIPDAGIWHFVAEISSRTRPGL